MRLDRKKIDLVMARHEWLVKDLSKKSKLSRQTINRALQGFDITPRSAGVIARTLDVDIEEIVKDIKF